MTKQQENAIKLAIGEKKFNEIMNQELPNGVWCTFGYGGVMKKTGKTSGFGFYEKGKWCDSLCGIWDAKYCTPSTEKEIETTLTNRCKELGLFDNDFKCLVNGNISNINKTVKYHAENDTLTIGVNVAYKNGKFAEPIKNIIKGCEMEMGKIYRVIKNSFSETKNGNIILVGFFSIVDLTDIGAHWTRALLTKVELITEPFTVQFNKK